jgi:hypothetical protein
MIHPTRQTKDIQYITTLPIAGLFIIVVIFLGIPSVAADGVNLSIPQDIYYFPVGMQAALPISIESTYSYDVTGTLSVTTVQENEASENESIRSQALSAFTDERTVMINMGESDVPADYRVAVIFTYGNGGQHSVTLPRLTVRYVTNPQTPAPDQIPLFGTDTLPSSSGSTPFGNSPLGQGSSNRPIVPNNPDAAIINAQIPQDSQAFKSEIERKLQQSAANQEELMGYIGADPLVGALNSSLTGAGFKPGPVNLNPASNQSGRFSLTYLSGKSAATISGIINNTHIPYAEESSHEPVPLPDALTANATFQEYVNGIASDGHLRNQTLINLTPDLETVTLVYADPDNHQVRAVALIRNGTVSAFTGDRPDETMAILGTVSAVVVVILLSAGIWHFARKRDPVPSRPVEQVRLLSPKEVALHLITEAEQDAARNQYPEAYRKTGRALRIFLSHTIGDGTELTTGELEMLIAAFVEEREKTRRVLDRCTAVGFAKDTPDAGEFQEIIGYCREVLREASGGTTGPGDETQDPA